MQLEHEVKTNVGRIRTINEDNFCVDREINLFVVADGMGGHKAGEIASNTAVEIIKDALHQQLEAQKEEPADKKELLGKAIEAANAEIYRKAQEKESMKGMGTTVTLALIDEDLAYFANVGDSRAYLIRESTIEQITDDHSWVNEQVKNNLLSKEEARIHRFRNIITRALGIGEKVEADFFERKLQKNDFLLLCSDGLNTMLEDEEIKNIILKNKANLKKCCQNLIKEANRRGGEDNITVIVVKVKD
jgi:protein phosphatase